MRISVEYETIDKVITIVLPSRIGFTARSIRVDMYEDTYDILRVIANNENHEQIDKITIENTIPLTTAEGHVETTWVMQTHTERRKLDDIDWNREEYLKIPEIVTVLNLHPELQE